MTEYPYFVVAWAEPRIPHPHLPGGIRQIYERACGTRRREETHVVWETARASAERHDRERVEVYVVEARDRSRKLVPDWRRKRSLS